LYQLNINRGLEPGGYLEMSDMVLPPTSDDGTLKPLSYLSRLSQIHIEAGIRSGRRMDLTQHYPSMFAAAGFVDITVRRFKWPSNEWPRNKKYKEMGRWNFAHMAGNKGLEGLSMGFLTRVMGMTREETEILCEGARREIGDLRIHAYLTL
jgi:hypothetical protein